MRSARRICRNLKYFPTKTPADLCGCVAAKQPVITQHHNMPRNRLYVRHNMRGQDDDPVLRKRVNQAPKAYPLPRIQPRRRFVQDQQPRMHPPYCPSVDTRSGRSRHNKHESGSPQPPASPCAGSGESIFVHCPRPHLPCFILRNSLELETEIISFDIFFLYIRILNPVRCSILKNF